MKFNMILAVDDKNGIWKNNTLAWRLSKDTEYYKKTTSETQDLAKLNVLIMWRKTWESIPSKFRPLPGRINCVLSRTIKNESINSKIDDFVLYFNSIESCLQELEKKDNVETIFINGWSHLYNNVLSDKRLEKIYLTRVFWDFSCDVFFDGIPKEDFCLDSYTDEEEEKWVKFRFEVWKRIN